jgi:hypothetical protein
MGNSVKSLAKTTYPGRNSHLIPAGELIEIFGKEIIFFVARALPCYKWGAFRSP